MRSSILPRLKRAEISNSRSCRLQAAQLLQACACDRSRNRPLTERAIRRVTEAGRGAAAVLGFRGLCQGIGIPGHAVDWHFALVKTDVNKRVQARLCPSRSRRHCQRARWSGGYQHHQATGGRRFRGGLSRRRPENHHLVAHEGIPAGSSLAERSPGELTPRVKPEKQPAVPAGPEELLRRRPLAGADFSHPSVVSRAETSCARTRPSTWS